MTTGEEVATKWLMTQAFRAGQAGVDKLDETSLGTELWECRYLIAEGIDAQVKQLHSMLDGAILEAIQEGDGRLDVTMHIRLNEALAEALPFATVSPDMLLFNLGE